MNVTEALDKIEEAANKAENRDRMFIRIPAKNAERYIEMMAQWAAKWGEKPSYFRGDTDRSRELNRCMDERIQELRGGSEVL